ncbi:DUF1622 domain-containing protein [Candidatus Micrarchaeota archaeon]|nr:DUF1622 domain-containing protein [Candidatus Micrarchaeota archaeon]MBU1166707.1 DUF1622 domain-containing protein [Candidatus Micrarchaeota archaeon]MBU1886132.1 DUF1622 domain-containing protein [Candidatus Micrarchaeota archaeon]
MLPGMISDVLNNISLIIAGVGIIIIIYGVAITIYRMLTIELSKGKRFHQYEHVKRNLIQKIIFSLDFFVAADLIQLSIVATIEEIASIAVIVGIRTILSWSLSREIHLHKE